MEEMLNSREKQESKLYALIAGIFSFFLVIQAIYTVNVISVEGTPNTSIVAEIVNLIYMLVFTIALFVAKSKIPFVALTGFSLIYNFANIDFETIRMLGPLTIITNIINYVGMILLLAYCILACVEKQNKIKPFTMQGMCLSVLAVFLIHNMLILTSYLLNRLNRITQWTLADNITTFYSLQILTMILLYGRLFFLCIWLSPYNDKEDVVYEREKQLGFVRMYEHVIYLLFTCGVWELVWLYRTTKTLNEHRGEFDKERDPLACLLLSMFIPFYYLYWLYKTCKIMERKAEEQGDSCSLAVLCVVLTFIVGIVPPILVQLRLNDIAKKTYATESKHNDGTDKEEDKHENTNVVVNAE